MVFSVESAAKTYLKKEAAYTQAMERRRILAQGIAKQLAQKLGRADSGVRVIYGFGSVFETWRNFRPDSDIDLGMIGGDWLKLYRIADAEGFEVNLVDLESQSLDFQAQVKNQGTILYENRG